MLSVQMHHNKSSLLCNSVSYTCHIRRNLVRLVWSSLENLTLLPLSHFNVQLQDGQLLRCLFSVPTVANVPASPADTISQSNYAVYYSVHFLKTRSHLSRSLIEITPEVILDRGMLRVDSDIWKRPLCISEYTRFSHRPIRLRILFFFFL